MEGLVDWVLLICWCFVSGISAHGTLFSAFYGPSRSPDLTSSSTVTTPAPASSSAAEYPTPIFGTQITSDDPVLSTIYATTSTPKTNTANATSTTTPMTYSNPSTSTLTSTEHLAQSANPTEFDQQIHTSLKLERNITCNLTSGWSSSSATVVENASKSNQQYYNEDNLDTLGGLIAGCVVGVSILLLACLAVYVFVGHRGNAAHDARLDDDHVSLYVNHYVITPPIVYRL
ncbi:uncharacterized protein [Haliotis asinina]|uniref:uncharacterized protein n=1 Tax=Haliotis asinina TaxID=109174 RepID=UPI003531F22F